MLDEEYFFFLLGLLKKFLSNRGVGHENLIPRETTPFISTPRFREPRHSFDITSQGLENSPLLFFLPSLLLPSLEFYFDLPRDQRTPTLL